MSGHLRLGWESTSQAHGPNAGIFFKADALGVVALRIPSGMLAERTNPVVPMLIGLAITLLGLAAFVPQSTVLTLVLAGVGTGIGAGLFSNGLLTEMLNMSSERNVARQCRSRWPASCWECSWGARSRDC